MLSAPRKQHSFQIPPKGIGSRIYSIPLFHSTHRLSGRHSDGRKDRDYERMRHNLMFLIRDHLGDAVLIRFLGVHRCRFFVKLHGIECRIDLFLLRGFDIRIPFGIDIGLYAIGVRLLGSGRRVGEISRTRLNDLLRGGRVRRVMNTYVFRRSG